MGIGLSIQSGSLVYIKLAEVTDPFWMALFRDRPVRFDGFNRWIARRIDMNERKFP
jgi:hypothetical protein